MSYVFKEKHILCVPNKRNAMTKQCNFDHGREWFATEIVVHN